MVAFVTRNGVKSAYEVGGSGDPPIVFLHGWSCDRSYFDPQFQHFAAAHRVVAVDLRGHGESSSPEPAPGVYSVGTLADDVLAVARDAGLEQPIMVGHSLGALVALTCGARLGTARAAVMIDPAPIVNAPVKEFLGQSADVVEQDKDAAWRRGFANGWFLPTDTARRKEIIQGMADIAPKIAAASLRAIAEFDGASALRAIEIPLLSIGSAVPTDNPAELRDACPTITIGQTVGSGHFNHLEVPDQVSLMIERFLAINDL
jgi:pimeloyl-ACP methyl ester carboxylesterase